MKKEEIINNLKTARESSKKRNFNQTFDLIINLKDINLKNPDEQVDLFLNLPHPIGKKIKVCGLVGIELKEESEKTFEKTIDSEEFIKYAKDKKSIKNLANEYDFFVAQANLMGQIAKTFGRVFGPRNKMPNPKAGCVVPPKTNLSQLQEKLQTTIRASARTFPVIQVSVGKEDMNNEDIAENILTIYNSVMHALPKEENNISSILIKTTMGKPMRLSQ